MTGLGEGAHLLHPGIDLDLHIADLVAMLHYEDLHDVILVGHRYGGLVITGAADRRPERIEQLVYLDAALPENGKPLADMTPELMGSVRNSRTVNGVKLALWPGLDAGRQYGVTEQDDLEWTQARLTPQPWKSFAQPLRLTDEVAVKPAPSGRRLVSTVAASRSTQRGHRPGVA